MFLALVGRHRPSRVRHDEHARCHLVVRPVALRPAGSKRQTSRPPAALVRTSALQAKRRPPPRRSRPWSRVPAMRTPRTRPRRTPVCIHSPRRRSPPGAPSCPGASPPPGCGGPRPKAVLTAPGRMASATLVVPLLLGWRLLARFLVRHQPHRRAPTPAQRARPTHDSRHPGFRPFPRRRPPDRIIFTMALGPMLSLKRHTRRPRGSFAGLGKPLIGRGADRDPSVTLQSESPPPLAQFFSEGDEVPLEHRSRIRMPVLSGFCLVPLKVVEYLIECLAGSSSVRFWNSAFPYRIPHESGQSFPPRSISQERPSPLGDCSTIVDDCPHHRFLGPCQDTSSPKSANPVPISALRLASKKPTPSGKSASLSPSAQDRS